MSDNQTFDMKSLWEMAKMKVEDPDKYDKVMDAFEEATRRMMKITMGFVDELMKRTKGGFE